MASRLASTQAVKGEAEKGERRSGRPGGGQGGCELGEAFRAGGLGFPGHAEAEMVFALVGPPLITEGVGGGWQMRQPVAVVIAQRQRQADEAGISGRRHRALA